MDNKNLYCPVAVRVEAGEIVGHLGPEVARVTCTFCGAEFSIGPSAFIGTKKTSVEFEKQLQPLLAEDHEADRPHRTSYELPG